MSLKWEKTAFLPEIAFIDSLEWTYYVTAEQTRGCMNGTSKDLPQIKSLFHETQPGIQFGALKMSSTLD